jgi:hypothetical protein
MYAQQATPPSASQTAPLGAQTPPRPANSGPELAPTTPPSPSVDTVRKPETPMTPAQARELFRSVDTIMKFDSNDTGLPIRHSVKRRLTTRKAVEAFLIEKMKEDKDTARIERSSIVMKKFGMLEPDFELRPFMLSLLKEQIAGYYDSKTKTVNLLDWIDPEEQKPVLAHELTHALQDQHVDLDKWGDQSLDGTPKDVADDNRHLKKDETDTAREAALEGQAMVAYMDWSLAPSAQSLRTSPDVTVDDDSNNKPDPDSPVLSRAPFVIKESLLFPYQDGLRFEQILLKDHGSQAAFAAVLDRPPDTSFEVMHPHAYEQHVVPALLTLPDIHPLLDADYKPYDLGVMGELDVRMLGQILGGGPAAADMAATWDGGIYYAAQRKSSVAAGQGNSTASIGLMYLSRWTTPAAAQAFAKWYAGGLAHKYRQLKAEPADGGTLHFSTEEGPVVIATVDCQVFISEGFEEPIAAKLQEQLIAANAVQSAGHVSAGVAVAAAKAGGSDELSAPLVHLFGSLGMMKAGLAVQGRAATARAAAKVY